MVENITKTQKPKIMIDSTFAAKTFPKINLNNTMLSSFVVRKKKSHNCFFFFFIRLFMINFGNGNVAVLLFDLKIRIRDGKKSVKMKAN